MVLMNELKNQNEKYIVHFTSKILHWAVKYIFLWPNCHQQKKA